MKKIAIISLVFLIFSCNNDESNVLKDRIEEVENTEREFADSPCELISTVEVKGFCSIPSDIEIEQLAKDYTYPTCVFKDKSGISIVTIVMVKNAKEDMFEISTGVYKDGISIDGVGEKAKWGAKMSQLSFLAKGYMFHVNVIALSDSEENKKVAMDIARFLVGKV